MGHLQRLHRVKVGKGFASCWRYIILENFLWDYLHHVMVFLLEMISFVLHIVTNPCVSILVNNHGFKIFLVGLREPMLLALELSYGTSPTKLIWKIWRIWGENKTHFREAFQICRSEVEQLQIFIDNKSLDHFFVVDGILIEWQLNSFHNCLIGEMESHRVKGSLIIIILKLME